MKIFRSAIATAGATLSEKLRTTWSKGCCCWLPQLEATVFTRESRVGSGRGVWGRVGRRRFRGRAPPRGEAEERKPLEEVADFDGVLP